MKQVLLFPEFEEKKLSYEQLYLCIISYENEDLSHLLLELSPKVMTWKPGVWIVDLGFCINYWQTIATQQKVDCLQLWKCILSTMLVDRVYYSSLSFHPWQSLLLAYTLEELGMKGLTHIDSIQGKNIFPHISWDLWWRSGEEFLGHDIAVNNSPEGSKVSFRQKIKKMQLSMKRLGCQKPINICHMSPQQMHRRYGSEIQKLWLWTYHYHKEEMINSLEDLKLFPWKDHIQENMPSITRNLDYPVLTWNHIEETLRDDLNKLCLSPSFNKGEHIMSLEWRLVLPDLSEVPIHI